MVPKEQNDDREHDAVRVEAPGKQPPSDEGCVIEKRHFRLRKCLEAEHYAVDVTSDGEQARAMAGELDYDLLMLDLNLPRVDGVTILRHLRTRKPSLPILVLTSRNRVEDRIQCLDLGADDYMGKPFSFAERSARIRALLRRSHLPAAAALSVADLKI